MAGLSFSGLTLDDEPSQLAFAGDNVTLSLIGSGVDTSSINAGGDWLTVVSHLAVRRDFLILIYTWICFLVSTVITLIIYPCIFLEAIGTGLDDTRMPSAHRLLWERGGSEQ